MYYRELARRRASSRAEEAAMMAVLALIRSSFLCSHRGQLDALRSDQPAMQRTAVNADRARGSRRAAAGLPCNDRNGAREIPATVAVSCACALTGAIPSPFLMRIRLSVLVIAPLPRMRAFPHDYRHVLRSWLVLLARGRHVNAGAA